MDWEDSAERVLAALLQMVPETYRELAGASARDAAEDVAAERGRSTVTIDDVVRGWIVTTPPDQRDGLVEVLEQLGLDPEEYADDLASSEEEGTAD